MSYVPIVPSVVVPPPPPSPRTRELAGLLGKVLEEYRKAHPSTTSAEIRAAIRLAAVSAAPVRRAAAALALGAVIGATALVLVLGLVLSHESGGGEGATILNALVVGLVIVLLMGFLLFRLRSR